ncbi:MAG: hypothetical protein AAB434_05435 [Planctomycetota bacterium]
MDLDAVVRTLAETRGVDDWVLRETRDEEVQAYVAGDRTETVRRIEAVRWGGTVLNDHGGKRGMAAFHLTDGGDPPGRVLADAVTMAALSDNPPFRLPAPAACPAVECVDADIARDPREALEVLLKQLRKGNLGAGVRLSSAEVFVKRRRTTIANSRGVRVEREGTEVYVEAVLTASAGAEEAEHFYAQRFRRVADASLG